MQKLNDDKINFASAFFANLQEDFEFGQSKGRSDTLKMHSCWSKPPKVVQMCNLKCRKYQTEERLRTQALTTWATKDSVPKLTLLI